MGFQLTVEDDEDRTIPEDTILRAKLLEITPKTINWNDRSTGEAKTADILEWWMEVIDNGNGDSRFIGRRVKASCNAKATPSSQLIKWTEALLGRAVGVGTRLDTDDLIGLQADVVIAHRKGRDGRVFEQVSEMMNPQADPWGMSGNATPPF